jgi:hypothetical protein
MPEDARLLQKLSSFTIVGLTELVIEKLVGD